MSLKSISAIVILASALLFGLMITPMPVSAQPTGYGPRNDLKIFYYADETSLYGALKAGEIDLSHWEVTPAQYYDAIKDPAINLNPMAILDYRAWSLNNNETIAKYPDVRNPLTDVNFRRALWRLSDVSYYTEVICGGFAEALPVPVAAPSKGWYNMSVVDYVKRELSFSVSGAKALLDAAGFKDIDDDGIRNYPAGWPGAGTPPRNIDPIVFFARVDDLLRHGAGTHLRDRMLEVGIPVDFRSADFPTCYTWVMSMRNYHIYSAGWSVGKFPTYLYAFFHSEKWFPGGSNYHVSTTPAYPDIDELAYKVFYPASYEEAMKAVKDIQHLLVEKYAIMIPLWSTKGFYAYRNLLGVVNMQGRGPRNVYTYLNAYRVDDPTAPIRMGLKSPALEVNQIYSRWVWDVETMKPVIGWWEDAHFIGVAPYDVMIDQPWLAQDWEWGKWVDPDDGKTKSKMTYWLRKGAEWIEPITGKVLEPFTTAGYEFNCWYFDSEPAGWMYTVYRDIKYVRPDGPYKVDVYFDVYRYWDQYTAFSRNIYAPAWKQAPLSTLETRVFVEGVNATTPGFLPLPKRAKGTPVEIVEVKVDGVALTPYTDYEICGSTKDGPRIRIYKDIPDGKVMTAKYWARGDPAGYHPGGLGWDKTLIGWGTHYMTDHKSGAGGWSTYKANRHFFLETPPLGEMDFYWHWIEGPKPRSGYYMIDIADAVMGLVAYATQGSSIPDLEWQSGADLVKPAALIDIYDIVAIIGKYGTKFGAPP